MRRFGAASEAAWAFARVEEFWRSYRPLTPLGKDEAEARQVLADKAPIEACLDRTEAVAAWLASPGASGADKDRVAWHLRRIPRLPSFPEGGAGPLDLLELFQVKKFLANYRAVRGLVPAGLVELFRLTFPFGELALALDSGGSDPETFFIADAYGEGLPELRAALRELNAAVEAERKRPSDEALSRFGLDFRGLEFVLVRHEEARALLSEAGLFSVDAWDDERCAMRLRPTAAELGLLSRRDVLLAEEAQREARVIARLSGLARASGPALHEAAKALCSFDCARARAVILAQGGFCRPRFGGVLEPLAVEGGVFLPCRQECLGLGLGYSPLDLSLPEAGAVIFGSNMGGKTVALQSLLFFQVLAQAGFHVPASCCATSVWPLLHYVGQGANEASASGGLSGFGSEVRSLVEAMAQSGHGAFLVFDEFARTTSSHEAEALLSAIIGDFASRPGMRFLFSTHFTSVARVAGVRYLRVRGLDRMAARQAIITDDGLGERIRRINSLMAYGLVDEDAGSREGSDALAIASLLGLEPALVASAEAIYAEKAKDTICDKPKGNAAGMEMP